MGLSLKSKQMIIGTLALLSFSVLIFYVLVLAKYADYQKSIENMEPRISRLVGIKLGQEQFEELDLKSDEQLSEHIYLTQENDEELATRLQQKIKSDFETLGLSVSSSQILPARQGKFFNHLYFELAMTGNVEALRESLLFIETAKPKLFIENLSLHPIRARRGATQQQMVNVKVRLFVLKGGI